MISEALARVGYPTREAATGHAALDAAREEPPALVLLELRLPDMVGYELYWELRQEHGDSFPIFLLSGDRTDTIDRVGGLVLGADDFIVKPFDPDELVARVRRSVGGLPSRRSHRQRSPQAELTQREQEVLQLLAEGLQQKQIAHQMSISVKTVATHIQRMLTKLDVHSRAELVALAHRERRVTTPR